MTNASFWYGCLGEMLGVMVLIILGNGSVFATSHSKMFANQPGKWIVVIFGWMMSVIAGAFIAIGLGSPGHINSAVSLFATISEKNPNYLIYIIFQLLGAILGQLILDTMLWKYIKETCLQDKFVTRSAHCTNPVIEEKNWFGNFLCEFISTAILLSIILVVGRLSLGANNFENISINILITSSTVLAIGCGIGATTGYAINPARDLGPRIVYQILKKKMGDELVNANWRYSWVPIFAPLLAGIIIGSFGLIG